MTMRFFVEEGQIELTVGDKVYIAKENSITLLNNLEQLNLLKNHADRFRHCVDVAPIRNRVLRLIRLKYAAAMLHNTAMPVNGIAYRCGFSNINNFCKQV